MAAETPRLDGRLYALPFEGGTLADRVTPVYDRLLEADDRRPNDVLVLKRFPTGIEALRDEVATELGLRARPNVQSLNRHARSVLAEMDEDVDVLADFERIETLAHLLRGYEWETDYFRRAAALDSFDPDVGRVLLAATWSGGFPADPDDPLVGELQRAQRDFEAELAEISRDRDDRWVEQAGTLSRARRALDDPAIDAEVTREFDVVLVLEFEEFGPLERSYLAALTTDADLVCVGEEHASIARVWNEPGDLAAIGADLRHDPGERSALATADSLSIHERVGRFLATGAVDGPLSNQDDVFAIREDTFEEEIRTIANEIEYLRDREGWRYDDFAVLFKDSNGPIQRTRDVLHRVGIPAASATVSGLREDRAVRECYALARYCDPGVGAAVEAESERLLRARIDDVDAAAPFDDVLDSVEACDRIEAKLEAWIVETDLKGRLMDEDDDVEIFSHFAHVRDVLEIAAFVDRADFLPRSGTWEGFRTVFDRAARYVSADRYSADLDVDEDGVLVDAVRLLKHDRRKAVFLVDVVEGEYPTTQRLTSLFPREWVTEMSGYPGVTDVTDADVSDTFQTADGGQSDPFDSYYANLSRRQLAIGTRAASDRLYFCMADRGGAEFRNRRHPSRYLRQLVEETDLEIPVVGEDLSRDLYTQGRVSRLVLGQPWEQLDEINRAASVGKEYDAGEAIETFQGIAGLLDEAAIDPRLAEAIRAQIDAATGEVGADDR